MTANHKDIQNSLNGWGILHFNARELTRLNNREWLESGRREHDLPPVDLLKNIRGAVTIADTIRERAGHAVPGISGYRSDEYNAFINGDDYFSQHTLFKAFDLRMPREWAIATRVVNQYRALGWNVGIGYYDWGVHIDVDAVGKPKNRRWDFRS